MDTAEFLRTLPYFSKLRPDEVERLVKDTGERRFDRGDILFLEGELCPGLYVVKEGRIRIFKTSPDGKEQVLTVAGPGATFNDVPVFDGGPNPASAEALEPGSVYIVAKEAIVSLISSCPMALSLLRGFAARLRQMTGLVEDLSFRKVVSRLAKVLLESVPASRAAAPPPRLTQQEMAAMVGTARDVVGRALRDLEREGAIRIEGRQIIIANSKKLRDLL